MVQNNSINKKTEDLVINKAAGDPFVNFQIGGADKFTLGVDDTDSDMLKITTGASPSAGTTYWNMTSAGERTMPLQSAFFCYMSASAANLTGDSTNATAVFNLERWDQNADFDTGTYTFTAPVTGKYYVGANLNTYGFNAHTLLRAFFATSNYGYRTFQYVNGANIPAGSSISTPFSFVCDMDAADTAYISFIVDGGTKVISQAADQGVSYFSMALIC